MKKTKKDILEIDAEAVRRKLVSFIKDTVRAAGFKKVVLGLSGGVDSATVAYLSKEALGAENVVTVMLPYDDVDPDGRRLAAHIIETLKTRKYVIDIAPAVDAYFENFPEADNIRRGNKMARERMSILYDLSKKENALVIGSGNRTEILMGYCTLHGDTACALNPLAGLYKTQVLMLAGHLGVPEEVIRRKPTAGLWAGQTDEEEIGCPYGRLDRFLSLTLDAKVSDDKLKEQGFDDGFIADMRKKMKAAEFKVKSPITPGA